jgi:DNA processing protein
MEQLAYFNALNRIASLTPRKFFYLLKIFDNNPQVVWNASYAELKKTNLDEKVLNDIITERKAINPEREIQKLMQSGISIAIHPDMCKEPPFASSKNESTVFRIPYPYLLAHIQSPPPLLYCKGTLEDSAEILRLAVVGSRKASQYGRYVTDTITYKLALQGIIIVSGFAMGVDTIAHKAAIRAKKPTIAVMGAGLDSIYPPVNTKLAEEVIALGGALVSEFPIGVSPLKQHFPRRNRIISGLCKAVLIAEAAIKSGSLITALHAIEQNRDVFAIPGNITQKNSEGTNSLIKRGAKLITEAEDILQEFNLTQEHISNSTKLSSLSSQNERLIYQLLSEEPHFIDTIITKLNLLPADVNTALTMMEIKGAVKNIGGGWYSALS